MKAEGLRISCLIMSEQVRHNTLAGVAKAVFKIALSGRRQRMGAGFTQKRKVWEVMNHLSAVSHVEREAPLEAERLCL